MTAHDSFKYLPALLPGDLENELLPIAWCGFFIKLAEAKS